MINIISKIEATVSQVDKALTDAFTTAEALAFNQQRVLTDGVGMNDSADLYDGFVFDYNQTTANVAFATDSTALQNAKALADTAASSDAGFLVSQGYASMDYFAEDYVGDARAF